MKITPVKVAVGLAATGALYYLYIGYRIRQFAQAPGLPLPTPTGPTPGASAPTPGTAAMTQQTSTQMPGSTPVQSSPTGTSPFRQRVRPGKALVPLGSRR
jgi:hypothetical protein